MSRKPYTQYRKEAKLLIRLAFTLTGIIMLAMAAVIVFGG